MRITLLRAKAESGLAAKVNVVMVKKKDEIASKTVAKMARRIRFPWLFGIMGVLFGVDVVIPDMMPFVGYH